ncbi:MAG: hypothetical protein RI900_3102 [Actinomycetota bacterium]
MTEELVRPLLAVAPLPAALGATVHGLDVDELDGPAGGQLVAELLDAWSAHKVLFFPGIGLSPAQQVRLASVFGPRIEATTEAGSDYRGAPTLADEGFPQLLLLDTGLGHRPATTNEWHTDVTFVPRPPIGSLFAMEIPAESGGDTMWSDQHLAYEGLSEPIRQLISGLSAVHGRPPGTGTSVHPMVGHHPVTGRPYLNVNRGWTRSVRGLHAEESTRLLEMLFDRAERPELQVRWHWSAGDAALWDNRCTMHYALADYGTERRRARRATIYAE